MSSYHFSIPDVEIASNIIISTFYMIFLRRHSPSSLRHPHSGLFCSQESIICSCSYLAAAAAAYCIQWADEEEVQWVGGCLASLTGWLMLRIWLCPLSGTRINGRLYFRAAFALFRRQQRLLGLAEVVECHARALLDTVYSKFYSYDHRPRTKNLSPHHSPSFSQHRITECCVLLNSN